MPDYDGAIQIDPGDDGIASQVDTTVETSEWNSVAPSSAAVPSLYFIDGVRRTEARALAWDENGPVHGLFGTVASGAVQSDGPKAVFHLCAVNRLLVLGSGYCRSESFDVAGVPITFNGVASVATNPAEITSELQEAMRQLEAKVAESVLTESSVVLIDGPLAYITSLGPAIGVIKRITEPYLDADRFGLVASLPLGHRTPLFLISDGKRDRYSWYLRIGQGRVFDHALAGIT